MLSLISSEASNPNNLKCAMTEIAQCGENDKPDSKYFSDESTTMCAHKPGVESCFVSKLFDILIPCWF